MAAIDFQSAAQAYRVDPRLLQAVNQLENSGRATFDVNRNDSNWHAGTPSAGPFQFIEGTFRDFAPKAREDNPAAWRGVKMNWRNPQAQALAAAWAFANGKGSHWTTFSRAKSMVPGMRPVKAAKAATGVSGPSTAMPVPATDNGGKAAALSLIFGDDPIMAMAAARSSAPAPVSATPLASPAQSVAQSVRGGKGGKGVPARRQGEPGWKYLQRVGSQLFGLENDPGNYQSTGGRHAAGSDHYSGTAIDFGNARNSEAQLDAWSKYVRENSEALGVKQHIWREPGHHDHTHTSTLRAIRGLKSAPKLGALK